MILATDMTKSVIGQPEHQAEKVFYEDTYLIAVCSFGFSERVQLKLVGMNRVPATDMVK